MASEKSLKGVGKGRDNMLSVTNRLRILLSQSSNSSWYCRWNGNVV
ncbi:hypothetical protein PF006_g32393, partial [Phytophthora fragariae]